MKYIVQVDPNNGISLETKEEVFTYLKHFGYENPMHMQGNEYEVSSLGDNLPAITILQKIPSNEDIKKEVNYKTELLAMVAKIKRDIETIEEDSEFLKKFIEKYDIGELQREQYIAVDITKQEEQVKVDSVYVFTIYDNYKGEYTTDKNGSIKSWPTLAEAQAAAEMLNKKERAEEIVGDIGVVDEGAIISEADLIEKEEVRNGKSL